MLYKDLIIIPILFLLNTLGVSQSLVLNKINDIETTGIYAGIKQIEPLPSNKIAVSLITTNYSFGGEIENLSILNKDTVIQIFEFYQRPYEISFIQFDKNSKFLYAVKKNISQDIRDVWLHRFYTENNAYDSLVVPVKYWYLLTILEENYLSFFSSGKDANVNDSLLLEQVFDIKKQEMSEVWRVDTIKKGVGRGNRIKDKSYYTLSIPTYGATTPDRTPKYIIIRDSIVFKQIEFYSSNEVHNSVRPFVYSDYNPVFSLNDSSFYIVYEAFMQFHNNFTHRNYILASFNTCEGTINWQYHGIENYEFLYVKPTTTGTHLFSSISSFNPYYYQFINTNGELEFEDNNSGEVRYCTANDECFVYSNDTIFLKKFDEVLAYHAFENLEDYNLNTFHPDDEHHYVTLKQKGTNIISIYQLRLDTMVNIIEPPNIIKSFDIYPNPASNVVNLTLPTYQHYTIEIHQLNGKATAKYNFTGEALQLTNLNLATGTYFIRAKGQLNEKQYFSKLFWLGN